MRGTLPEVDADMAAELPPLYAIRSQACWLICKERPASLWDALADKLYVGTSFSKEPPALWDGVRVVALVA